MTGIGLPGGARIVLVIVFRPAVGLVQIPIQNGWSVKLAAPACSADVINPYVKAHWNFSNRNQKQV
jgi:hypothetical protein